MLNRLGVGLVAVALFSVPNVATARPQLASQHLDRLGQYDVLVFSDPHKDGLERGKAIGVIDATPEEVFRIATDYSKYQEYMPRIVTSRVLQRRAGDAADVELSAQLPLTGTTLIKARYHTEKLPGDIYRVRFDLLGGAMKQYFGSLYIEPWGSGKTAITYTLLAEPRGPITDRTINWGIRRSCNKFVHALRQRINEMHRLGFLHPQPVRGPEFRSPITLPEPTEARRQATR